MKKSNFLAAISFIASIITACATPTPLPSTPIPNTTPTNVPTDSSIITTTGAFFALSVADINASADWYSEKLGLEIVTQPPKTGAVSVIVLEGGNLIVELIQHDDALPFNEAAPTISDETLIHGIFKAGVIVENFDAIVAILRERNVTIAFGPYPATTEQRANVIIQDNEGNLIQFFGK
jgi:catechol 2,3-dioxygenase-like lactoylglutathione lyase family enzyme